MNYIKYRLGSGKLVLKIKQIEKDYFTKRILRNLEIIFPFQIFSQGTHMKLKTNSHLILILKC